MIMSNSISLDIKVNFSALFPCVRQQSFLEFSIQLLETFSHYVLHWKKQTGKVAHEGEDDADEHVAFEGGIVQGREVDTERRQDERSDDTGRNGDGQVEVFHGGFERLAFARHIGRAFTAEIGRGAVVVFVHDPQSVNDTWKQRTFSKSNSENDQAKYGEAFVFVLMLQQISFHHCTVYCHWYASGNHWALSWSGASGASKSPSVPGRKPMRVRTELSMRSRFKVSFVDDVRKTLNGGVTNAETRLAPSASDIFWFNWRRKSISNLQHKLST